MGKDHPDADLHPKATGLAARTVAVSQSLTFYTCSHDTALTPKGPRARMLTEALRWLVLSLCPTGLDSA